jgi:hypothetical protein
VTPSRFGAAGIHEVDDSLCRTLGVAGLSTPRVAGLSAPGVASKGAGAAR